MTQYYEFIWQKEVAKCMLEGATFDKWTEDKENSNYEPDCLFKVDEFGFFVYWKSAGNEGAVLELSQVSDIRTTTLPNDKKIADKLIKKHGADCADKSLAFCSGLDFVNVNLTHIVCKDVAEAKKWQKALQVITNNSKMSNVCPTTNLKKHWMRLGFMVDAAGKIPIKSIVKTFASGKTEKLVYTTLQELELPCEKGQSIEIADFTYEKFFTLYETICPRTDIDEVYNTVTKADFMIMPQLIEFLNEHQRDPRLNQMLFPPYNERRCIEIINIHETNEEYKAAKQISKRSLLHYLMSDENAPVLLKNLEIYQEMDHPMNHYYINSSHNTYLSGKQFGGKSTAEMYRQTLLSGCRCVELDCWDGKGEDEEPIITHGKAMCTDIMYIDAIKAIKECAFLTSNYPIVLSYENHCCKKQQYKLAKYADEQFGDMLLKGPIKGHPLDKGKPMPPPNKLLNKILIKNKRLKPEVEKVELESFKKGVALVDDADAVEDASKAAPPKTEEVAPADGAAPPVYSGTSLTNIHPWLSSMVNYAQPVHFNGFEAAEEKNIHHNMSSFSETAGLGYMKSQAIDYVNYNKRQMARIYPKGARVDSSNFMPQVFWNAGCQLVSLNFQTPDLPMQLNLGKFEYNGNCGYLLKPEFMRKLDKTFDPFAESPVDGVCAAQLGVSIIAGQFLSDKKIGTYVEVDMYGLPTDTIRKEFRTRMVPANGLNPQYSEEPFVFRKVVLPDLAVLRIGVYDENNKMLGQRILPLDGLNAGYRHISLRTEGNFPMSLPMLFVKLDLKIYVPDGLGEMMDALSDPRAFMNAQQKREEQMKAMGIEASDLDTKGVKVIEKGAGKKKGAEGGKEEKKAVEYKMDPINLESLRTSKIFLKATKKQVKELAGLKKKQTKEKLAVQKTQCSSIDKAAKGKKDVMNDPDIKKVVTDQMKVWSDLIAKHRKEEWAMLKLHLGGQEEILKTVMVQEQALQMKELETKYADESKEMKAGQAATAVQIGKDVAADKTLKTKAERDRRLKEKNENNTGKIIKERKALGIKQGKFKDKQIKLHETQLADLSKDIKNAIEFYDNTEQEYTARNPQEFFC